MSNDLQAVAEKKVEERAKAKCDKMYLANDILGYDFQDCHRELFGLYPTFNENLSWDEQTPIKDLLVLWPRGHYKSTAVKVVIIQAILCNPDLTILLMQGSVPVTQLFLKELLAHFTGEASGSRLKELFPEFCGTRGELKSNNNKFTVPCRKRKQTPQATCTVSSPRAIKTGQHYDLGVFDDLQNESNSHSSKLLAKVQEQFQGCQPLVQHGSRWVSGTRWAHGDLYEQIMRWNSKGQWTVSVKDCWTDDKKGVRFPKFVKKSGQTDGFTREDLLYLQEQDVVFFSCQYLNRPALKGGQRFPKEFMETALIAPQDTPPLSPAIFFVDLASTDSQKSDDSVIIVGKTDLQMNQYVVDGAGGKWVTPALAQNVIELALKHRPTKIMFEKTAGSMYFVDYVRLVAQQRGIFLPIDFLKIDNRDDAKYMRISTLEGLIRSKRLQFLIGLPIWDRIVEQFGIFPGGRSKHDDYPDTIALMSNSFGVATLSMPRKPVFKNPILAMMAQREHDLAHVMEEPFADDGGEGFIAF